ncbi:MAG: TonB-dependent receptor, partial [Bacteroidia bacterium]|nr:TonB-dependent receptor [Bacteroidia bacterium]
WRLTGKTEMELSFRLNSVTLFSPQWNLHGLVSRNLFQVRSWRLKSWLQFGRSVRIPSLNELYFLDYGNPSLKPEIVWQIEGAILIQNRQLNRSFGKMTVFHNQTQNKIVSIPISPVRWTTLGLGRSQTTGWEVSGLIPFRFLQIEAQYTHQVALDYSVTSGNWLPYTPSDIASARIQYQRFRWGISCQYEYCGGRFASLQNDFLTYLNAYHLLNVGAHYDWKLPDRHILSLETSIRNVLSEQYKVIQGYPMPSQVWIVNFVIRKQKIN